MNSISTFIKLVCASLVQLFTPSPYTIIDIPISQTPQATALQLQAFEKEFVYPFSAEENFTIQHGLDGDYFAFFKDLGTPYYTEAISKDNQDLAGAVCCVERTLRTKQDQLLKAWYICDLKVGKKYQGTHLPIRFAQKIGLKRFLQCPRGFAIFMNPQVGEPRAASIFKKNFSLPGTQSHTLHLYTLSAEQALAHKESIRKLFIKHGYLKEHESLGLVTTAGKKDYIINNTKTGQSYPWKLLHFKRNTQEFATQEGGTHMLCAVKDSALDNDIQALIGTPSSTALILSYGMNDVDFNSLSSDEI